MLRIVTGMVLLLSTAVGAHAQILDVRDFGTPAIAHADAGRRAMTAIAQSAVNVVLKVLDGGRDEGARVADRLMADPGIRRVVDRALEHEREIEKKQTDWLAKQPK